MTIAELYRRVNELDIKSNLPIAVAETSYAIAELNKLQLSEGKYRTGEYLNPLYSNPFYANYKQGLNSTPPSGVPDLRLTGSFYDAFHVNLDGMYYEIDSTDNKSEELKEKYSDDIFGLSEENKAIYALEYLFDEIAKYITSETGLGFSNV